MDDNNKKIFKNLKNQLLNIDPVYFCENYLTLDGKPFRLSGNGYKPFTDIYRYIGVKALEPDSKPIILVKGRQVGGTTMASALEMYFMGSGIFGVGDKPSIRVIHAFPLLELAAAYSKTKLNPMITSSIPSSDEVKSGVKIKSYMQSLLDTSSSTNDSLHFKQFVGGNHVWIESTGLTGDRLRGRQICLETDIPTPDRGFIKLKDLKEGDQLFDENGKTCNVIKLHPIDLQPESYKVIFDDGSSVDACADHLWLTYTKNNRVNHRRIQNGEYTTLQEPTIKSTKEILNTLKVHNNETNHSIPTCQPLQYPEQDLILDPYLLGFWLGDGDRRGRIETADPEVLQNFEYNIVPSSVNKISSFSKCPSKSASYRVKGLTTKLRKLKLSENNYKNIGGFYNKHIPDNYMKSSFNQRLSLLQGLMDSDGCCYKDHRCEFTQTKKELAYQVYELITGLGIKARIVKKESGRYKDRYRITFITKLPVFRLERKLKNLKTSNYGLFKNNHRFIVDIQPIDSKPMRCLTVDSPSNLFLITKSYIPTHNTGDVMFFDECFPYTQNIQTENGKIPIGKLYKDFISKNKLPKVLTFNEKTEEFEYKKITNAWKRNERELFEIQCENRKIKCTGNHKFLTTNGWKQAQHLIKGDLIKTSHPNINQISYDLNNDQYQIILGSFLGDGHIHIRGNNKFRLKEIHGINQEQYCSWKASMFNVKTRYIEKNGYAQKPAVVFNSQTFILKQLFPNTKHNCPQWILDNLDERGLAIWFMDDGSISKNIGGCLNTCSFDEDSQKRMVKKLQEFGITCKYKFYKHKNKNKGYYSIYFNKNGYNKLCELVSPYIHNNMQYKLKDEFKNKNNYKWDNNYKKYGLINVKSVKNTLKKEIVYDIEVEDNHNFIAASSRLSKCQGGLIAHNCQNTTSDAIGNSLKILTAAKYGKPGKGVQVYFGTPLRKGSDFHKMWGASSQQYFYLGCTKCKEHFPLYTPGSDEWENIWLHGFIVKCTYCGHEQDKRESAELGKWKALKKDEDDGDMEEDKLIGFHINQLYMPFFTKEDIISEKPGIHPTNTERVYMNEVLGEFFQGDASPITVDEIREKCGDFERKFISRIAPGDEHIVTLGIDYGAKSDLEQLANPNKSKGIGQSYSTAVVLTAKGPNLLSIEFATKFKRNDIESKKGIIDQIMRQYSIDLAVGDIGYSHDFSDLMHTAYGDRYIVSRASNKINNHVKFNKDTYPKEIGFERNYYISELFDLMKKGQIKFPFGDYEKIGWLVSHCASMEIKPSISRVGEPTIHYVKGNGPNDGFMALLNAYLAYKFILTEGFSNLNPILQQQSDFKQINKPLIMGGYISRNI